jgi:hypothetical protein
MFGNQNKPYDINQYYPGQMQQGNPYHPNGFFRNTPYPYQPQENYQYYQPPNYYNGAIQPYQPQQNMQGYQNNAYFNTQKDPQFLFHNPLQPQEDYYGNPYAQQNGYQEYNPYMNANPYPKQGMMPKQPGGFQSFMNSFKSQDGSVDYNKMMNTAGQMMNAVNQVSSLVKGFGGMFKI